MQTGGPRASGVGTPTRLVILASRVRFPPGPPPVDFFVNRYKIIIDKSGRVERLAGYKARIKKASEKTEAFLLDLFVLTQSGDSLKTINSAEFAPKVM